ncbi:MAG: hypothetical protein JST89_09895 [Cyanobacteria bacterium SZAS-4]|nr:hypothetical protein [Cyanobacteria bacterium SZAS-4]
MAAENFTPKSEKAFVDSINNATYVVQHPGHSPGENFIDQHIVQPMQAWLSAENIAVDFLKEFKANPEAAIYNWREIKGGIHQNDFDLPKLQLIDELSTRYEELHGKLPPVKESH